MNDWQTPVSLLLVALAAAALVRGWLVRRKRPGCGGSCPADRFKAGLKHRDLARR